MQAIVVADDLVVIAVVVVVVEVSVVAVFIGSILSYITVYCIPILWYTNTLAYCIPIPVYCINKFNVYRIH